MFVTALYEDTPATVAVAAAEAVCGAFVATTEIVLPATRAGTVIVQFVPVTVAAAATPPLIETATVAPSTHVPEIVVSPAFGVPVITGVAVATTSVTATLA